MRKILPRCQICDGPISNGRCRVCGMPYRNDEVMYHLNENRRDHDKHASEGAKQAMKQAEKPLYDRPAARPAPKTQTAKKKSGFRWVLLLFLLMVVGIPKITEILPRGISYLEDQFRIFRGESGQSEIEELELSYILKGISGEISVGEFLEPGRYTVHVKNGYATLWVETEDTVERYHLSEEEPQVQIKAEEGNVLSVHNSSSQDTFVEFYTKE